MSGIDAVRYDLKTPCKNCPFRTDETRIVFANRERAEEIEESAYRNGFPCHLSANLHEDEDGDGQDSGYYATDESQHCVGYVIMRLKEDGWCDDSPWPGIENSERVLARYARRVDRTAPVFEHSEEFFRAQGLRHRAKPGSMGKDD